MVTPTTKAERDAMRADADAAALGGGPIPRALAGYVCRLLDHIERPIAGVTAPTQSYGYESEARLRDDFAAAEAAKSKAGTPPTAKAKRDRTMAMAKLAEQAWDSTYVRRRDSGSTHESAASASWAAVVDAIESPPTSEGPAPLFWHCAKCGAHEPVEQNEGEEYEAGDREKCITCDGGWAVVQTMRDAAMVEQAVTFAGGRGVASEGPALAALRRLVNALEAYDGGNGPGAHHSRLVYDADVREARAMLKRGAERHAGPWEALEP